MRSIKSRTVLTIITVLASMAIATVAQTITKPFPAPARWRPLIGQYDHEDDTAIVLEKDGKLGVIFKRTELDPLREISNDKFQFESGSARAGDPVVFSRDSRGKVTQVEVGKSIYIRRPLGPEEGSNQLRVEPLRPVPTLIKEARTLRPPVENGDFLPTDLVELTR